MFLVWQMGKWMKGLLRTNSAVSGTSDAARVGSSLYYSVSGNDFSLRFWKILCKKHTKLVQIYWICMLFARFFNLIFITLSSNAGDADGCSEGDADLVGTECRGNDFGEILFFRKRFSTFL